MAHYRYCAECGEKLRAWEHEYCEACLDESFLVVEEDEDWEDDDDWEDGDDPFLFFKED